MNTNKFISIKSVFTLFGLLLSATIGAQVDKPKPFNDTLIPVHDPVIIRQDSIYYIFCTGQSITVFSSEDMKHWKPEKPVFDKAPGWAVAAIPGFTGHIWAPDISFFLGLGETTTQPQNVPYLDVSVTWQNGERILNVVNRNKDEAITADIISQNGAFMGNFSVSEINGPDIKSSNDFNNEIVKTIEKPSITASGSKITYSFPPHSFTMIKGKIQK